MPAFIVARLYRILPLVVVLAITALVVYAIMSWRYTPARAKEALITVFTWLCRILSAIFLLFTLYALLEGNTFVAEFFATCLAFMLIVWGITYLCKRRFLKNNPNYRWHTTHRATKTNRKR